MDWEKVKEMLANGYSFSIRPVRTKNKLSALSVQIWKMNVRVDGVFTSGSKGDSMEKLHKKIMKKGDFSE